VIRIGPEPEVTPANDHWEHFMGLDNPLHIAFLLILVLLVFGAKRLPEMGHSLGAGLRGFRDALSGDAHPAAQATELSTPAPASIAAAAPAAVSDVVSPVAAEPVRAA
jgi:sec-independent protein translocase protein TatA